jgi:uncharacterized protein (DUF2164 family)
MKEIKLNKIERQELISEIKHYFLVEKGEEVSDFNASLLLDFIIETVGPYIYNQAVRDAHELMSEKIDDLFGLEHRPR